MPAATQSVLHGSTLQLREILKGGAIYVSSPLFASRLPGGAHWLRINLSQVEQALGLDPSSLKLKEGQRLLVAVEVLDADQS